MNSSRVWSSLFALLCWVTGALLALSALTVIPGCGGATGLQGGKSQAGSGAALADAGAAGNDSENGGKAGLGGSAGGAAGSAAAGASGVGGTNPAATLLSIELTPAIASVAPGTKAALVATALYSDQSRQDVTAVATWASDSPKVATVARGLVSAVAAGNALVSATLSGQTGSAKITVPNATVKSLAVTPATGTTGIQGTVAFQAVVTLSDGTTQDVTATATWKSSNTKVATVTDGGLASGVAAGTSTISAAAGGATGSGALTITSAILVSIAVTPTNPTLGIAISQPFSATGTFSDGSVADVSSTAIWASATASVATIDAATHVATTLAVGTTTISASIGKLSGSTTLQVTAANLLSIVVAPATSTIAIKGSTTLSATGTYSDGSMVDLSQSVTWSASDQTIGTVSNASGTPGTVTGVAGGTVTINAALGSVTGSASVTVTAATLVSIAISPENPSLPVGTTASFVATGTYSDSSVVDITSSVTWSTDDPKVASVSNADVDAGLATAVAIGTTNARASLGMVSGSTTVTVTAAKLVSIAITPANPSVPAGTTRTLSAIGTYSDASTLDLTTTVVWSSSTAPVATVSNAASAQGLVTAVAMGATTVKATLGSVSGSTVVTVAAPTVTQVVIAPIASSLRVGQTVRYTATAILSNNTQRDVTQNATWSSSDTKVATLTAGGAGPAGGGRLATAVAVGTTTISAVYQGVTGSTPLTVTSSTLSSIQVTPIDATLSVGTVQQFTATAIYSDNTSQDVTAQATWQSSNTGAAQVSTGGGMGPGGGGARGTVTAIGAGGATISASLSGQTGSATLTVTAATLVSIQLTPDQSSVAQGTQVTFVATALYSDNSTRNVSALATWVSSNPTAAAVSSANGSKGQAKALASGGTTISATYAGVSGSTLLTVTSATLTTIQITPFSPVLLVGFNSNLVATGIYSDNTTRDLTALVTWTSNAPAVASVSDTAATRGQVTPLMAGTGTVSVTYQGITGTDAVVVSAATLTGITVTPASVTISNHTTQAFTAQGTLSDATTLDMTNYVTWLSTVPATASVSNANGSRGLATALATGTVTISAVRGALTGTATLTVQ